MRKNKELQLFTQFLDKIEKKCESDGFVANLYSIAYGTADEEQVILIRRKVAQPRERSSHARTMDKRKTWRRVANSKLLSDRPILG